MSLTIAKQYIWAYTDLHQKNPDKIRISVFGVKNKPKIRICQSGTDLQTLLVVIQLVYFQHSQEIVHFPLPLYSSLRLDHFSFSSSYVLLC